jgi:hypothetical protein
MSESIDIAIESMIVLAWRSWTTRTKITQHPN